LFFRLLKSKIRRSGSFHRPQPWSSLGFSSKPQRADAISPPKH